MIFLIVPLVVLVVGTGLLFTLGAGLVAIVPAVLAVGLVIWLVWAFAGARSPGSAVRHTEKVELLGPGGPD
ncbi:MAG TPA: hypothetical protein VH063_14550, partial [Gaiellaceae bacterium]|nr:hypothetical protein [Gaiellaceae bacterium]